MSRQIFEIAIAWSHINILSSVEELWGLGEQVPTAPPSNNSPLSRSSQDNGSLLKKRVQADIRGFISTDIRQQLDNNAEAASSQEYGSSQDIGNLSQLNSQEYEEQLGVQQCIDSTVIQGNDEYNDEYNAGTTKRDESVENNVRRDEYMCEENVSSVEDEKKLCKPDKRGHCCVHGTK